MADDGNDGDYADDGGGEEAEGEEPSRAAVMADTVRSKASEAMGMFSASSKGVQIAIVGGAIALVALLVWFIRRRRQKARAARFLKCGGCVHKFSTSVVECSDIQLNDYNLIEEPRNNSCTYSIWINVRHWNAKKWKSIFYKGTQVKSVCETSLKWNSVLNQCPGIWLTEGENNVRIAVVTEVDLSGCRSRSSRSRPYSSRPSGQNGANCGTTAPCNARCIWDATESKCKNSDGSDATTGSCANLDNGTCQETIEDPVAVDTTCPSQTPSSTTIIEYADVKNIPIGEWFMLCVVMTERRFEAYVNGDLWLTKVLLGSPKYNREKVHFGKGSTTGTVMSNFHYMPHALPSFMVKYLYNQERKLSFRKRTKDGDHDY